MRKIVHFDITVPDLTITLLRIAHLYGWSAQIDGEWYEDWIRCDDDTPEAFKLLLTQAIDTCAPEKTPVARERLDEAAQKQLTRIIPTL